MYYRYIFYVKREKNKLVVFFFSENFVHSKFPFLAQLWNTKNEHEQSKGRIVLLKKIKTCEIMDNRHPCFVEALLPPFRERTNFFVMKWERDEFRANYSLNGILPRKEYEKLYEIPLPLEQK